MKAVAPKERAIKINVIFAVFFLIIVYFTCLQVPSLYSQKYFSRLVHCSSRDCRAKKVEDGTGKNMASAKRSAKEKIPAFFDPLHSDITLGLVNMGEGEALYLGLSGKTTSVHFDRVRSILKWNDLFPGMIDEENEDSSPTCPEIPMPDISLLGKIDVVVAKLPCRLLEAGWARDVFRLQVHLVVAYLAVSRGRRDEKGAVKVGFNSECRPMMEIFRCDDLVGREEKWWMYEVEVERLEEKVRLPVGSCRLALPISDEGTNMDFVAYKPAGPITRIRREAYATVLHSSDAYVCGALALAQSIRKTGSTRDLVLLHDAAIPYPKLRALSAAGWQLRPITRIRNLRAQRNSYNEYNYSKLRLWELTDYHKVIFVDSDILVLRNLDPVFSLPELSAAVNHDDIFNSGVMVVEPSNCTFNTLMKRRNDVISYNGGDQGLLNEVFVWWHRLPKRVNFLTFLTENKTAAVIRKNYLFGSDPVKIYGIHYLGLKPWDCYRDNDCNWNKMGLRVYASDVAHWRWWTVYDEMDEGLKRFCGLTQKRKESLERERKMAEEMGFEDEHWRLRISDPRRNE